MHMSWSLTNTVAPAAEPLTLAEAKAHLRVDSTSEDALITTLITVARQSAETFTRRALITQTWALKFDAFPDEITVPLPPLQSVTSIGYVDSDGAAQTLATSGYQVNTDTQPGRIKPAYGARWPATRADTYGAVTVTFVAGYGAAGSAVPEPIRQAMLMQIGHMFERRETSIAGTIIAQVPMATEWLLWPYRDLRY